MSSIGLIDVDGHNFPNLALMKLSAFHKINGDSVEWYTPFSEYDIVYKAKVFTFTQDYDNHIINSKEVISGGTGYKMYDELFCDKVQPDYSIYNRSGWYDDSVAYGFLTRGCPNKCEWCIVPKKEGGVREYMDIEEIAQGKKRVVLMDNNILASDYGLGQIEKIIKLGIRVDFNQGLDARMIANNEEIAKMLGRVKWIRHLRMACDSSGMKKPLKKATELLRKHNCKPSEYFVYVLLRELGDSYDRINFCKDLGLKAFAQPFRDFTPTQIIPQWQKDMAHYTNKKSIYYSCDFKDFSPRKGFVCNKYF